MRYFAVVDDGRIKTITNVYRDNNTKIIYFTMDNLCYRYDSFSYRYECEAIRCKCKSILVPRYSFQKFVRGEWLETQDVELILFFDETEDEDLNYFQSTDFNAGYIYNKIERSIAPLLKDNSATSVTSDISIPVIQLLPSGCETGSIKEEENIMALHKAVIEHFDAVYGKNFELIMYVDRREKRHIVLGYSIKRKEQYKEMTVAEIEEALGYKIKVVGE